MLLLMVNIIAGTTASAIYALWAVKWWQRGCRFLGVLNAIVALDAALVATTYALVLATGDVKYLLVLRTLVSLVILMPAVTRLFEMRREARREAVAGHLEQQLRSITERK